MQIAAKIHEEPGVIGNDEAVHTETMRSWNNVTRIKFALLTRAG
jgi:hypothetical protein